MQLRYIDAILMIHINSSDSVFAVYAILYTVYPSLQLCLRIRKRSLFPQQLPLNLPRLTFKLVTIRQNTQSQTYRVLRHCINEVHTTFQPLVLGHALSKPCFDRLCQLGGRLVSILRHDVRSRRLVAVAKSNTSANPSAMSCVKGGRLTVARQ